MSKPWESPGFSRGGAVKCDKPTPIYADHGGDPVGCSHCGARWGARP